jgi:hypothetical protein
MHDQAQAGMPGGVTVARRRGPRAGGHCPEARMGLSEVRGAMGPSSRTTSQTYDDPNIGPGHRVYGALWHAAGGRRHCHNEKTS